MTSFLVSSTSSTTNSSLRNAPWKHQVFLSFAEDTHRDFAETLRRALWRKGILAAFVDESDETLRKALWRKGILAAFVDESDDEKLIQESKVSVVIFSTKYASSSKCLNQVSTIADCKNQHAQTVLPVFYDVEPTHVRKQQGDFGDAFNTNNINDDQLSKDKSSKALYEICKLSGWHLTHSREHPKVIQEIVDNVLKALNHKCFKRSRFKNDFVGLGSRVEKMMSYLDRESKEVRTVGIWGTGGIGKTSIAKEVFESIGEKYDATAFVKNIREENEKPGGIVDLKKGLYKSLLGREAKREYDEDTQMEILRRSLRTKSVLIILDDVGELNQIQELVGKAEEQHEWFGEGSRVIVTTRNKHLLEKYGNKDNIYEVEKLTNEEALKVLCRKALKKDYPPNDFKHLSKTIVRYAHGLPLALVVLGSYLYGRSKDEWSKAADRLKSGNPKDSIYSSLRLGYSGLRRVEKEIFLDIACFFKGEDTYRITKIFESSGFHPTTSFSLLQEKALISIEGQKLWMHDLLQEVGWGIVCKESRMLGERSRLWHDAHARSVLSKNEGKEKVQGIFLVPRKKEINLKADPFLAMENLRLLRICNVNLPECFEYHLSQKFRLLEWHGYPLKSLPSNFQPRKLVELSIPNSCIEQIWAETTFNYEKLILMDFSNCHNLTKSPDFSKVPNLEKLILEGCEKLSEINSSIGDLQHLILMNLEGCKSLVKLPRSNSLKSLETLILSGCSKLEEIPEDMKKLCQLFLDGTAIRELPDSVKDSVGLISLNLKDCKNLLSLPSEIVRNLTCLESLNISGCSRVDQLPEELASLERLKELFADGTAVKQVPSSILRLKNLKFLTFRGCKGLRLPATFSGLSALSSLDLSQCDLSDGALPGDIGHSLSSLQEIVLAQNNFTSLPESFSSLSKLRAVDLSMCTRLRYLPRNLPLSLRYICVKDCPLLKTSDSDGGLKIWSSDSKGFHFIDYGNSFDSTNHVPLPMPVDHADALFPKYIKELIIDEQRFEIRFPYNRIPDLCSYWSSGSRVKIELSQDDQNLSSTKGLAVFVVVEIKENNEILNKYWELGNIFFTFRIDGIPIEGRLVFENLKDFRANSYVICCYMPREWFSRAILIKARSSIEALFESTDEIRDIVELKMCGFHFIFDQDVEEFSQQLAEASNEHLDLDLNFSRHCKHLLDGANKLESSGELTSVPVPELVQTSTTPRDLLMLHDEQHENSTIIREIKLWLSTLFQGNSAHNKMFLFSIPLSSISTWFFHHSLGNTAVCYLPSNLYNDENWVGLELYASFTMPRGDDASESVTSIIPRIYLYAHGTSTILPVLRFGERKFYGSSGQGFTLFYHIPRHCFSQVELNQCKGISVFFRFTRNVKVEKCGTRLLYKQETENFVQAIIECAKATPNGLFILHEQAKACLEGILEFPYAPLSSIRLSEDIQSLQKFLTGTQCNTREVSSKIQEYISYLANKKAYREFDPMVLHSKKLFFQAWKSSNQKTAAWSEEGPTLEYGLLHLHLMVETLLAQSDSGNNWKQNLKFVLQEFFNKGMVFVSLTLRGNVISVMKGFDPWSTYNLCFPRKEILPWFDSATHIGIGSTVAIEIPPNLCSNESWRGLAICAEFSVREHPAAFSESSFKLLCHLSSNEVCLNPASMCSVTKDKFKWLHLRGFIWLTYIPRVMFTDELNEKTQHLVVKIYNNTTGLTVNRCGIRLLNQEDVEDFKGSIIGCCTSFFDDEMDTIHQFMADERTLITTLDDDQDEDDGEAVDGNFTPFFLIKVPGN